MEIFDQALGLYNTGCHVIMNEKNFDLIHSMKFEFPPLFGKRARRVLVLLDFTLA